MKTFFTFLIGSYCLFTAAQVSGQTSNSSKADEQVSYLKRNSIKVNLIQLADGVNKIKMAHQRKGNYMVQLLNMESKTFAVKPYQRLKGFKCLQEELNNHSNTDESSYC